MQQQPKTLQQLQADLREMQAKAQDPQSTPERRRIYASTAQTIQAQINQRNQQPTASAAKPAQPAPQPPIHTQPAPPRSAKKFTIVTPSPESGVPKIAQASPTSYHQRHSMVEIEWGDGTAETLRYHQVRSRFGVCLTDLIQSVAHRKGDDTHKKLENYAAYADGQTYYAALTTLWGKAPTFEQLNITSEQHPEETLREMFDKLTAA